MSQAEIIEVDYRPFLTLREVPEQIRGDLHKCNVLWSPTMKMQMTSEGPKLLEVWGWRGWMYRSTPSIPVQAQFLKEVEVRLPDSQVHLLKPQAERQMLEAMKPLTTPLSFAVFLCLDERYTQGIVAGEVGCLAVWVKRLVLLGRWLGKRESEDSKREES